MGLGDYVRIASDIHLGRVVNEVFSLPMYAELTDEKIQAVVDAVRQFSSAQ